MANSQTPGIIDHLMTLNAIWITDYRFLDSVILRQAQRRLLGPLGDYLYFPNLQRLCSQVLCFLYRQLPIIKWLAGPQNTITAADPIFIERIAEWALVVYAGWIMVNRHFWPLLDINDPDARLIDMRNGGESTYRAGVNAWNCREMHGTRVNMDTIHGWLRDCQGRHGVTCSHLEDMVSGPKFMRYLVPQPLLLVDVHELKLVSKDTNYQYIALSYVWGKVPMFKTTTANIASLTEPGSLHAIMDRIPPVIQDAISITKALGKTYLWVDSLCIIQDDIAKHSQLKSMDRIFGSSALTIIALSGTDANARLPGVLIGSRPGWPKVEVVHGLRFIPVSPPLSQLVKHTCHNTRAWTFQESILPLRCLYFAENQMYFRCHSGVYSEDRDGRLEGSQDFNPFSRLRSLKYFEFNMFFLDKGPPNSFVVYALLVGDYTQRYLSYDSDIENAFLGILSGLKFVREFNSSVACLPDSPISRSLLWITKGTATRRVSDQTSSRKFPTWSWTGWKGHTNYSMVIGSSALDPLTVCPHNSGDSLRSVSIIEAGACRVPVKPDREPLHLGACSVRLPAMRLPPYDRSPFPFASLVIRFVARAAPSDQFSLKADQDIDKSILKNRPALSPSFASQDLPNTSTILQSNGSQCGYITFHDENQDLKGNQGERRFFISVASSFCKDKLGDIDDSHYLHSYKSSEGWCGCLIWFLFVEEKGEFFERVAVGQIHPEAFELAGAEDRVFNLI